MSESKQILDEVDGVKYKLIIGTNMIRDYDYCRKCVVCDDSELCIRLSPKCIDFENSYWEKL